MNNFVYVISLIALFIIVASVISLIVFSVLELLGC
ncbi:Uncharacterised protein [Staphylococcus aureus]|nr:Uncharacterised protein [Staphylococcus aureus]CAC6908959.1 Uncharacterised protein [Staphylococcus aureus]CAC7100151.1 Uncharacterised protein [Staphylococcus aureus]CAC7154501.1 Uncharacterised protein [Staphylococcus aureus]CAC8677361.1 Uncharacterised protein [Staphylococcus aureus]